MAINKKSGVSIFWKTHGGPTRSSDTQQLRRYQRNKLYNKNIDNNFIYILDWFLVFKTQEHFPSSQPSKLPRPANLGGWLPKFLHAGILCRKAHGRVKNSADQSELPICFGELGKRRCQADSQLDITGFRGLHLLVWHEGCHHDRCYVCICDYWSTVENAMMRARYL